LVGRIPCTGPSPRPSPIRWESDLSRLSLGEGGSAGEGHSVGHPGDSSVNSSFVVRTALPRSTRSTPGPGLGRSAECGTAHPRTPPPSAPMPPTPSHARRPWPQPAARAPCRRGPCQFRTRTGEKSSGMKSSSGPRPQRPRRPPHRCRASSRSFSNSIRPRSSGLCHTPVAARSERKPRHCRKVRIWAAAREGRIVLLTVQPSGLTGRLRDQARATDLIFPSSGLISRIAPQGRHRIWPAWSS